MCTDFNAYFDLNHINLCDKNHNLNKLTFDREIQIHSAKIVKIISPVHYTIEIIVFNGEEYGLPEKKNVEAYIVDMLPLNGNGIWAESSKQKIAENFIEFVKDFDIQTIIESRFDGGVIIRDLKSTNRISLKNYMKESLIAYEFEDFFAVMEKIENQEKKNN